MGENTNKTKEIQIISPTPQNCSDNIGNRLGRTKEKLYQVILEKSSRRKARLNIEDSIRVAYIQAQNEIIGSIYHPSIKKPAPRA